MLPIWRHDHPGWRGAIEGRGANPLDVRRRRVE
jgi:hypothetical protein